MSELAERTSFTREDFLESLQLFENEGCRWGYGTISSSNIICYGKMNAIPSEAGQLASSMKFAANSGMPGADSELVSRTMRVANIIDGLRGSDDERPDYDEASSAAIELLLQWENL